MIKQVLIELIQESLPQIDKTSKYHDLVVEKYITMAANTILGNLFRKNSSGYDLYAKDYNATIVYDTDTDQYHSLYPAPIVQTIDPYNGVRSINTPKGKGLQFAPIRAGEMLFYEDTVVSKLSSVIPYIPERSGVLFVGKPVDNFNQTIVSIRMKLVVPFTEYDSDEFFHIPAGSDLEFIDTVLQLMGRIPPKDLLNDEKDPQWKQ